MGAQYTPTIVSGVSPGSPAWERDIRAGDVITRIDDVNKPRFTEDLRTRVMLSDLKKGLAFQIDRPGQGEFTQQIHPRQVRPDMPPAIGIAPSSLTKLNTPRKPEQKWRITTPGTPARLASPAFEAGDEFIKIGDRDIRTENEIAEAFTEYSARDALPITIRRRTADQASEKAQEITIDVARRPLRTLGLIMEIGPIVSVQDNSPAAKAGFKAGDRIKAIDGEPLGDPSTAPERLRRKQKSAPEQAWKIVVERTADGKPTEVTLDVVPRTADRLETPHPVFSYESIPTLGLAYSIAPNVAIMLKIVEVIPM